MTGFYQDHSGYLSEGQCEHDNLVLRGQLALKERELQRLIVVLTEQAAQIARLEAQVSELEALVTDVEAAASV